MSKNADQVVLQLGGLVDGLEEFKDNYAARLSDVEKHINRPSILSTGGGSGNARALAEEFSALREFAKSGEERAFNSLSSDSNPDGGYLTHPEIAKQIRLKLTNASPIRQLARVIEIGSGDSFSEPVDVSDAESGWVSERQTRPETDAGDLKQTVTPLDELYANVLVTQRLLDDSSFNVGNWIVTKVARRFGDVEDVAFVNGNQPHRPKGILTYDVASDGDSTRAYLKFQYTASGAATSLTADSLIDLVYSLRPAYRQNAVIVMNSNTARVVRKLKDGDGNFLWAPGLAADQPDRLVGHRVVLDENLPDVSAGTIPVVIADWQRAYNIVERPGIKWLRDPYSNKPSVGFYAYRRVGGGASGDFDAAKFLRVGTS